MTIKVVGANPTAVFGSVPSSDTSGTPGNATINARSGRFAIPAANSSVTITNNTVTAASHVLVQIRDADATLIRVVVSPLAGAFVVTGNANATAICSMDFVVVS